MVATPGPPKALWTQSIERHRAVAPSYLPHPPVIIQVHVYREFAWRRAWNGSACRQSVAVNISPLFVTKISNDLTLGGGLVTTTVPAPFNTPVTVPRVLPGSVWWRNPGLRDAATDVLTVRPCLDGRAEHRQRTPPVQFVCVPLHDDSPFCLIDWVASSNPAHLPRIRNRGAGGYSLWAKGIE